MTIASFSLKLGATAPTTIVVNGIDVSDICSGVALVARPRAVTKLTLEMVGEGPIEGLGDITIVRSAETLARFLSHVDPQELERVALDRAGGFGGENLTQAMLDVLTEWAGDPP